MLAACHNVGELCSDMAIHQPKMDNKEVLFCTVSGSVTYLSCGQCEDYGNT